MNHLTLASGEAEARAAEAVVQHHALMAGTLAAKAGALSALVAWGGRATFEELRDDLVAWARAELVPHAAAEERTLYVAAAERPEGRLLVEAMVADHARIGQLVDDLERATEPVSAAVAGGALLAVFQAHLAKENDQILPMLVAAPDVSVAELLGGMHELIGDEAAPASPQHGHACACGEESGAAWPELDVREVPHVIRHATVFGALDAVLPGGGLVLVAPHDPLPLLDQIESRGPGTFAVEYLQRGPDSWRLSFVRRVG